MVNEERCPNKSEIKIVVNTNFKHQHDKDGEDFRSEMIKLFHNKVFAWVEREFTENEDFEQEILELMSYDDDIMDPNIKEFMDLGEISIQLWEEKPVEVMQKDVDKEDMPSEDEDLKRASEHPDQQKIKT